MKSIFDNLNAQQLEAVKSVKGPVMAIAGAGSGKTRVLTRRIAHLIFHHQVSSEAILAITFTNKAANEMKNRIYHLLGIQTRPMWVSTFHSMCARILRDHIEFLGYDRRFQIIDDEDTTQLIKVITKRLGLDPKMISPKRLKPHIMNIKYDPSILSDYDEPLRSYLESIFPAYQTHLKKNNLLDFEDLLVLTIQLLKEHKAVRDYYHKQFEYVLVDEFQDTNNVQYALIKLLTNASQNIFIVGDEDQSIYAFRGSNIENIRSFKRDYPLTKQILLEQNYRSTNTILKAANQVIKGNRHRIEKNLFSTKGEGEAIVFYKGYTYRDEAEYVAQMIQQLVYKGYRYEDIAILYRANNTSRVFEDTLLKKHVPYQVVGNLSFFKRKEIKDMVAYLRLVVNPHDGYSYIRVVNEPKRGIGAKTIERLDAFASLEQLSLFDAVNEKDNPLSKRAVDKLKAFNATILALQKRLEVEDFPRFIESLVELTEYDKMLMDDEMGEVRYENIMELKNSLLEAQKNYPDKDKIDILTQILEDIALKSQEDEQKDSNVVTMMTLHAAKGLEFKVVFIVALEQGLFPLHQTMSDPKELEEERRLMYVGMTRTMERLFLTNAQERLVFGTYERQMDSLFIREIHPSLLQYEGLNKVMKKPENTQRMTFSQPEVKFSKPVSSNTEYRPGDKVNHSVFGKGVVVQVLGKQCKIAFDHNHGVKTLLADHPALKKVSDKA